MNGAPEEAPLEVSSQSVAEDGNGIDLVSEPPVVGTRDIDFAGSDRPEETAYERVLWAAMVISKDLLGVEALALGEPVPVASLHDDWAEWLGLNGAEFFALDEAKARRVELIRRSKLVRPALEAKAERGVARDDELEWLDKHVQDAPTGAQPFAALDLDEFLAKPPAPPDWDLDGWFARGDLVLAFGDPGVGKSLWALLLVISAVSE